MRRILTCSLFLAAFFCCFSVLAATLEPLTLEGKDGLKVELSVEIADTPAVRARGLMGRKELPEKQGMLFLMPEEMDTAMWMKNTPLPLDMLFIDRTGTIVTIATPKPLSTDVIRAGVPTVSVLEIGGGLAKKWGIREGDKVRHHAFD